MTNATNSASQSNTVQINTDIDQKKVEYGVVGKLLGGVQMAPISGACILGVVSLVGAIMVSFSSSPHANETVRSLITVVVACLSFLGGTATGKARR